VPAPWASLASSAAPGLRTELSNEKPVIGRAGAGLAKEDIDAPGSIDLNIFRTARGTRILDSLKEQELLVDEAELALEADAGSKSLDSPTVEPWEDALQISKLEEELDHEVTSELEKAVSDVDRMLLEATSTVAASRAHFAKTEPPQDPVVKKEPAVSRSEAMENPEKAQETLSKEDAELIGDLTGANPAVPRYQLRESRVPATRVSRLWNYGSLAAGMFGGAIAEGISRAVGGGSQGSMLLSPGNMERLVAKLSRMRGAALKMGQMMSFQDSKMLPAPIQEVLQRVQDRADYMPAWQRDRVLTANLGAEWRDLFDRFDEKPVAAASIGQVHRATLKSNGAEVAVKIQFPGVADSINSDLDNLGVLLAATKLLPKGLYLNKTIDNARTELAWECDYEREAICGERYRHLLSDERDVFVVPKIYLEASGKQVLTMQWMDGVGVTRMVKSFTQAQRDWIGTQILRLCLREITEFKFMQTDPNWTNFLYNPQTNKLELLDFGASREYPDEFIDLYVRLLEAASRTDRDAVKTLSEQLGYLTGHESKAMLDAHTTSVLTLAEPFLDSAPEVYDFRDQTITERVKGLIPVMIRERLAPPPEETYSLHRKLSGAFLLCARLGSRVRCRDLFQEALQKTDLARK
jgi:aarF domain-containing kinase